MRFRPHFTVLIVCLAFGLAMPASAADLYTVEHVMIDATAPSATQARETAMAQGRPIAWETLFKRLTPESEWSKLPQLNDTQLQRIIRSLEVANEKRSTTRYLAEVTYHFNQEAVQRLLRQSAVAYSESQGQPVLVIPVIIGGRYDPVSPWAQAWTNPAFAGGVVPMVLPPVDGQDAALLARTDLAQSSWPALASLASRDNASEIVIAQASPAGDAVTITEISPTGRSSQTIMQPMASFSDLAQAVAQKLTDNWNSRSAVDYGQKGHLNATIVFASPKDWFKIRSQIANMKTVADFDVVGLALDEAAVTITYFGRQAQFKDALANQSVALEGTEGSYTLRLLPSGGAP